MDIQTLARDLRQQASSHGHIVLDSQIVSEAESQAIAVAFELEKGKVLTIDGVSSNDVKGPTDGIVTVSSGTTSALLQEHIPTALSFIVVQGVVQVTIVASMPGNWKFTTSFPKITFFPFSQLTPTDSRFVYTSVEQEKYPWSQQDHETIGLAKGQNFLSMVTLNSFSGIIGVLGSLITTKPYKFYGPFAPSTDAPYPAGTIAAPISDGSFDIGVGDWKLQLGSPEVGAAITKVNNDIQNVHFVIQSVFDNKLLFGVEIAPTPDRLTFFAEPKPGAHFNTSDLIHSLPGGQHYEDYIPQQLTDIFTNIELAFYRMVLVTTSSPVSSVMIAINTANPWHIIPSVLSLESLRLAIGLVDPTGQNKAANVEVNATATFLPDIFKGDFLFRISTVYSNKWSVDVISGEFDGGVSLGDIVHGVVGSSVPVPDALKDIVFSNFGAMVQNTGNDVYSYTVYGSVSAAFAMLDTTLDSQMTVTFEQKDRDKSVHLSGSFLVGEQNFSFDLLFDSGTTSDLKMTAQWQATDHNYLEFADITNSLGFGIPEIPPELDLGLSEATFVYDFKTSTVILSATSVNYGTGSFIAIKTQDQQTKATSTSYIFQLMLGFDLTLSSLPLVGSIFDDLDLGSIKHVQVIFASKALTVGDVETINKLLAAAKIKVSLPLPEDAKSDQVAISKGFNFGADIQLGGKPLPMGAGGESAPVSKKKPPAPPPKPSVGNATWVNVKKSLGPVTMERIGVRYEEGRVWLLIDADFSLSMLQFGLKGLALGFAIPSKKSDSLDISAQLDGMSLSLETGPLTIAGGFLRFTDDYLGMAEVKVAVYSLTAIGGYAPNDKSFFIFVRLNAPLGGPPFFFITGLAGGFGINRSLVLPDIDQLTSYPLLPQNNNFPKSLGTKDPEKTLADTLSSVEAYIHPEPGEYWVAAGIDFTSFEMIKSTALLTVSFGVSLEVALLGIARITVPAEDPAPIAYLEIALEARFETASGLIAVDGRITPASFIYAGLCHVSGGFAFYMWYSGDHAGEFVVTVGGYHPQFEKPSYYPTVPRLEMIYEVGPLVLKGDCYFALVPHTLMAGFRIDATWKSGPISAWFNAGIDFLLGWRPFHYLGDAYIHLGASFKAKLLFVTVQITIHVGVDLTVWGPEFGGKAKIDLDIISFTIGFGSDHPKIDKVKWPDFKSSFLPGSANQKTLLAAEEAPASSAQLVMAIVQKGLVTDLKAQDSNSFFDWVLDSNHFSLSSNMVIPNKTAQFNDFQVNTPFKTGEAFTYTGSGKAPNPPTARYDGDEVSWTKDFGVLPMELGASGFNVGHHLKLMRLPSCEDYTKPSNYTIVVNNVSLTPLLQNVQSALWAAKDPGLNGARLVDKTLSGLQISPLITHPEITAKADLWALLFDTTKYRTFHFTAPEIPANDNFEPHISEDGTILTYTRDHTQITNEELELSDLAAPAVTTKRNSMINAMNSLGFSFDTDKIDVSRLARYPLWDWPMIELLGEEATTS